MKELQPKSFYQIMEMMDSGQMLHITYEPEELLRIKRIHAIDGGGSKLVKVLITVLEEV